MAKIKQKTLTILPEKTTRIINGIEKLRDEYQLFAKMSANTSKGHHVTNVMAYKRRDAMKHVRKEYAAIRNLVKVVDIKMPPV